VLLLFPRKIKLVEVPGALQEPSVSARMTPAGEDLGFLRGHDDLSLFSPFSVRFLLLLPPNLRREPPFRRYEFPPIFLSPPRSTKVSACLSFPPPVRPIFSWSKKIREVPSRTVDRPFFFFLPSFLFPFPRIGRAAFPLIDCFFLKRKRHFFSQTE